MAFFGRTGLAALRAVRATRMQSFVATGQSKQFVRRFAGGGSTPPPGGYTGMEKVVRGVLPEDYQIVIAFGSIEFGLIFLLTRGGDSEAEPAAPVATSDASASADIPSILSDEFEEWSKVPGNLEKWEASLEDMEKTLA
mmetsp:Transcript_14867/g.16818  ORF Transcript_14867/g.16818 Transcript_14867/m.16818 type:complete len:139 (+) Transcript_14867:123-539(+)